MINVFHSYCDVRTYTKHCVVTGMWVVSGEWVTIRQWQSGLAFIFFRLLSRQMWNEANPMWTHVSILSHTNFTISISNKDINSATPEKIFLIDFESSPFSKFMKPLVITSFRWNIFLGKNEIYQNFVLGVLQRIYQILIL